MSWYGSHSFLNEYIHENTCKRIMEIGVYNGENARTMVETAIRNVRPSEVEYYGFDFFMDTRFREVRQKLKKTGCKFKLFKGDTFDTLPKVVTTLPKMDIIFIDGDKSYTKARSDWEHSKTLMHYGTAIFVHNADFSGVQSMVDGISRSQYQVEVFHSHFEGEIALIKKKTPETINVKN